jgi:hypothetical protein
MKTAILSTTLHRRSARGQLFWGTVFTTLLAAGIASASNPSFSDTYKTGTSTESTDIYCCDAKGCIPVDSFSECLPDELIMVCDGDGICMPINNTLSPGKKLQTPTR